MDNVRVVISFTVDRDGRRFSDAISLSRQQDAALTPAELEGMKEERYAAWQANLIAASSDPGDPSADLGAA